MKNVLRTEKLTRILPNEIPVTLVQDIDISNNAYVQCRFKYYILTAKTKPI